MTDNIDDIYKLSPVQQGLLFHCLYAPESDVYFEQFSWTIDADLDLAAFTRAWELMQARHSILRTAFLWEELDEPLQVVQRQVALPTERHDWRDMATEERGARIEAFLAADRRRGFDLTAAPLMRLTLIRLADDIYQCIWSYHHLLLDGWSAGVLLQDVLGAYEAVRQGRAPNLQPRRPYRDYIAWLRRQDLSRAEAFWRRMLGDVQAPTLLPLDGEPGADAMYAQQEWHLSEELTVALQALARQRHLTLYTLVLGAWAVLLNRYSGAEEVVFGVTVAGRPLDLPGSEAMVGMFINTLPVRVRVPDAEGLLPWLEGLQAQQVEIQQYAYSPLVQIQGCSGVPRGTPLFQSILVFENYRVSTRLRDIYVFQRTNYPLTLVVEPGPQMILRVGYEGRQFAGATITGLVEHLRTLLEGMVAAPGRPVGALSLLSEGERRRLLERWRGPQPAPAGTCLPQLVEAQAARTPDAVALMHDDQRLTYAELNARANRLARHLRRLGVGPEVRVGVCVERSFEMVVGLLGILKAGGAYVPLDPAYPSERLRFMLEDARVAVLLTATTDDRQPTTDPFDKLTRRQGDKVTEAGDPITPSPLHPFTLSGPSVVGGQWSVVDLDADWARISQEPDENLDGEIAPDNLAYVIYTSGSTGRPKGVQISHRALANFLGSMRRQPGLTAADTLLAVTTLSFDIAGLELWLPLVVGARVVIAGRDEAADGERLAARLRHSGATVMQATPATWRMLLEVGWPGDRRLTMLCGGEALPRDLAEQLLAKGGALWNMYGPTETTIWSAARPIAPGADATAIGAPIADTQLYLLDRRLHPVPPGAPGELYIGGAGLARGYLDRPDLTAERFVPCPWPVVSGQLQRTTDHGPRTTDNRLYRTGDLARARPDGTIEFLGRLDQQIKLRGYRIEVGEIEVALRGHAAVRDGVVVARNPDAGRGEDVSGEKRLVAYVVTDQEQRTKNKEQRSDEANSQFSILNSQFIGELREYLKTQLPDYMIPATFVTLEALPLTPAGKVDRRALPDPELAGAGPEALLAPRTPEEELVAGVFAEVLGRARVGAEDHFFTLGGHSLLATRVISKVREAFAIELPLRSLFEAPTVAALAERIVSARRSSQGTAAPPLRPMVRNPDAGRGDRALPLSFAQQRLWFLDQLEPANPAYHIPVAVRLDGALDCEALRRSLGAMVRRHETLRTTFVSVDGRPVQVIAPVHDDVGVGGGDGRAVHEPPLPVVDLSGLPEAEREAAARRLVGEEFRRPFDLARGPLLRAAVLRLGPQDHVVLVTMHHIITDGWSMGVFGQELAALYKAFHSGQSVPLSALPIQYADYAVWQRQWLEGAGNNGESRDYGESPLQAQLAYWKQQLADLPALDLPTDRQRPPAMMVQGALLTFRLPQAFHAQLIALGRQAGVTLFMTLLAAFQVLLARYVDQDDIAVGTPIANRTRAETEGLIGCFVNTLVLRADLAGNPTFRELLGRVREVCLQAYAHQDVPFEQVVDVLQPGRDLGRHPLFQVMFALQNAPRPVLALPGLAPRPLELAGTTTKFDLSISIADEMSGLVMALEYRTDLFEAATIERMAGHFQTLLAGITADPDCRIAALPLLSAGERRQLLAAGNVPARVYPSDHCLHELFAAHAARTPDALAVTCGDRRLTYGELDARANQLAHYLQRLGVGPDVCVGLYVERSPELIVGVLGILKAGGAYVPLDPSYPAERLRYMLADAQVSVVLTTQEQRTKNKEQRTDSTTKRKGVLHTPPADDVRTYSTMSPADNGQWTTDNGQWTVVDLVADWEQIAQEPETSPDSDVTPQHLAYVIYTSGSTGRPKGVMVRHAEVARLLSATDAAFRFGPDDVWTLFHSIAFDFSVWELWGALAYGGRLAVVPYWVSRAPEAFHALLVSEQVTVLNQTPSAFRQLQPLILAGEPGALALRLVIFGGEALEPAQLRPWYARYGDGGPQLVNMYGITETTVHVTYRPLTTADATGDSGSRIGTPLPDLEAYVLDRHGQPAPLGVPGELYIGGAGLARGYLGRPDLTAERFVPNPFANGRLEIGDWRLSASTISNLQSPISERLYRTGDLARWCAAGELEYLGRIDQQVKLRGFRIELGEIAAALASHPAVGEVAVLARDDVAGDKRLVAYVVPDQEQRTKNKEQNGETPDSQFSILNSQFSIQELRAFLKQRLPDYMIPSFVMLDALPLTSNGKLDRRALPLPDATAADAGAAPRTPHEELLAEIWADVLGQPQVGIYDNFFELGGHSLLATQVAARVRAALGVELPLRRLFEAPTVAGLAAQLEITPPGLAAPPLRPLPRNPDAGRGDGAMPLSFAQQRLWFLDQVAPGAPTYNVPAAVRLRGPLDISALRRSLGYLVARHETLRTTFDVVAGQPVQVIAPGTEEKMSVSAAVIDLHALPDHEREAAATVLAAAEAMRPFDLRDGPLLRVTVLRLRAQEHVVLLTMHHIVSDGWSVGVLIRELAACYGAYASGAVEPALPPLPVQYADYAVWQRQWLEGVGNGTQAGDHGGSPLQVQLAYWRGQLAELPALRLPTDYPRPEGAARIGARRPVLLPRDLLTQLRALSRREGATLFMSLLAGFQVLLAHWSGQEDIVVGTDVAQRTHPAIEGLIGFFVNQLVLRADLSGDPTLRELLGRVREATLAAYTHQDLPFERLVAEVQPERRLDRTPLFQVKLILQNAPAQPIELPGLSMQPLAVTQQAAPFDLVLSLHETAGGLEGSLDYRADLFAAGTMALLLDQLAALLWAFVRQPEARLSAFRDVLAQAEQQHQAAQARGFHESRLRRLADARRKGTVAEMTG